MTEKLLQFIWQFQYFNRTPLHTLDGEPLQVVFPGKWNKGQGPDFLNANVRIGNTLLSGSVELHLKTSDWKRHGHDGDENYGNVVLHVVWQHDGLFQKAIPVIELQSRVSMLLLNRYNDLMQETTFIPCATTIAQTRALTWINWKERLVAERLTRKAAVVLQMLDATGNHWEETFWRLLARNFGLSVNKDAFEELACTIPVTLLAKHRNNLQQLEAALLGQANLLNEDAKDDYIKVLQREYGFLKNKYGLLPINTPVHFLRMRPGNFPTVRLAQLAMLMHTSSHLFSKMLEETDLKKAKAALEVTASTYWHTHYRLGISSASKPKALGKSTAELIIINAVIPTLFAYGLYHSQEQQKEKAIDWLQNLQAEQNAVTDNFKQLFIETKTAYDSQALLELKQEYCDARRCLQCSVGTSFLKSAL